MKFTLTSMVSFAGFMMLLVSAEASSGPESCPAEKNRPVRITSDYTGTVTDQQNNPVQGATVRVLGTEISVETNSNGIFLVQANEGDTLLISHINYNDALLVLTQNTTVSVV